MSSICGIFYRDGRPVAADELDAMVDVLAHWGPDRSGTWREHQVGLGHLALCTTPEAVTEICPRVEPVAGLAVTGDVRLDNREELLRDLRLTDEAAARTVGDVELIASAYEKWGEECVTHFVGDFAFVVWDRKNRQLFCARDPMGIRPFYYFVDDRRFLFGTEIKAILTHPGISRELNPLRFALFVIGGHFEASHTQFKAVLALEPATSLTLTALGLRLHRYWRLDPRREIHFARDGDYVEAFEEIFQRAVDARLRTTTRVGCMLSGGLDATTMLGFARRSRSPAAAALRAYTWALRVGDDWTERDEREYVDCFLREYPLEHHYIIPDSSQIFADRPAIRHLHDGPNWDVMSFATEPMFARAKADGTRVLLFGNGGDETASLFAHDHINALLFTGRWITLAREVQAEARALSVPASRYARSYLARPLLKDGRWRTPFYYQFTHDFFVQKTIPSSAFASALAPGLAESLHLAEYLQSRRPVMSGAWRHPVRASQIAGLTATNAFANWAALKWNNAVLHHVEGRYPFLDRRVIEFCTALPPAQHRQGGCSRRLLRRAAAPRIPAKIAWRRDKTLTIPDLARGILCSEARLRLTFERWRTIPAITALLDVSGLQSSLESQVVQSRQRHSATAIDTGAFCRAVLLGSYLDIAADQNPV